MRWAERVLVALILLLFAVPAWAVDDTTYSTTPMDQTCTDSFDTPTAATPTTTQIGTAGVRPTVQTSGTGDGFCDHDSRIVTGAIAADTTLGPFTRPPGKQGVIVHVDVDAITGGSTDYRLQIQYADSFGNKWASDISDTENAVAQDRFGLGCSTGFDNGGQLDSVSSGYISDVFWIQVDLVSATSFTGSMSLVSVPCS